MVTFSPDKQRRYCKDVERCLTGGAPSLARVRETWGERVAVTWLQIQIEDFAEYAGAQTKLTKYQSEELAYQIIESHYYLKMTEIMLFFTHYKQGRYGRFYGAIDPLQVMEALQAFNDERRSELARIDKRIKEQQREQLQHQQRADAMSREEYEELRWLFNLGYELNKK